MTKVKRLFGENPEKVAVLDQVVEFDANGEAEVSEEAFEVLKGIPGYEEVEAEEVAPSEEEKAPAPKKPAIPKSPKKPAPTPKKG